MTVLIVSVTLESIEILLNKHPLVDTYMLYKRMEKFSPLKLCLIFLWPLNVPSFEMCGSRKYPYLPPHGGSWNFLGVGGSKRDKFPKGRGVHKKFFFPEGLKCDRINTYVFFQLIQVPKKNEKFYP